MLRDVGAITSERLTGLIVGLGVVGVVLTSWLVASEVFRRPTCPPLLGIPACYLVVVAYGAATIGAWRGRQGVGELLFNMGAGAVTLIGAWFSVQQTRGTADCPTLEGLPMCFVSLFAGATMLALDQVRRRTAEST